MKKILLANLLWLCSWASIAQVGIGIVDPKAALDIMSSDAGILIPRMSTNVRESITVGADQNAMLVFDTDTQSFWFYEHSTTAWRELQSQEPWFGADNDMGATDNTEDIYTMGNVGIGTNSPSVELDVLSEANASIGISSIVNDAGTNYPESRLVFKAAKGTFAAPQALDNNDRVGLIAFAGNDGDGSLNQAFTSSIEAYVEGSVIVGSVPSQLRFYTTAENETARTQRMVISNDGNVGIGVGNPTQRLQVRGNVHVLAPEGSTDQIARIYGQESNDYIMFNGASETMTFVSDEEEVLTIWGGGVTNPARVGIGNTAPSYTLDIAGAIRIGTNDNVSGGGLPGAMRFNADINEFQGYDGTSWKNLIGGKFIDAANNSNNAAYTDGAVGIGTDSPSFQLDIWREPTAAVEPTATLALNTVLGETTSNYPDSRILLHSVKGTIDTPIAVDNNDRLGLLSFAGYDGTGSITQSGTASIEAFVDGSNITDGSVPSRLEFSTTAEGDTNRTARMVIRENGHIGIGVENPIEQLHVNGNILAAGTITPDYVFESYYNGESTLKKGYSMWSLEEVEAFTKTYKHLPGVPSAKEIKEKGGILLNRASEIQLEKIEELFLHTIRQNKELKAQQERIKMLEQQIEYLLSKQIKNND